MVWLFVHEISVTIGRNEYENWLDRLNGREGELINKLRLIFIKKSFDWTIARKSGKNILSRC